MSKSDCPVPYESVYPVTAEGKSELGDSGKIPASLPPEQVLSMASHELKHLANMIEGWATILSKDEFRDSHVEAKEHLLTYSKGVKQILDEVFTYLEARKGDDSSSPEAGTRRPA